VKFSLVLPVKDGSDFIKDMIFTVSNFMRPEDELIIVNDNSQDSTVSLLTPWIRNSPQIRLIHNPKPGLANALNLGINEASNESIARVDVDDLYSPKRLHLQQNLLADSCIAVFSDYSVNLMNKRQIGYIASGVSVLPTSFSLISSSRTAHPSVVFLKSAFQEAGGYRQEDFPCEDLSLWLRLSKIGNLSSVPEPLLNYRLSTTGVTASKRDSMRRTRNLLIADIGLSEKVLSSGFDLWKKDVDRYNLISHSNRRRILLLREFRIAQQYGIEIKDSKEISMYLIKQISKSYSTLSDFGTLGFEKILRKIYW
jgi:glycosyltransferase involved in cell wall biosynthesis